MTPKEKAIELLSKYYFQVQTLAEQKQCALIEVDEIIEVLELVPNLPVEIPYYFWNEVKQEIEKL